MLVRNAVIRNGLSLFILFSSGMGLLNFSLIQTALPAFAIAPGTPTATLTSALGDGRTKTGAVNSKLTPIPSSTVSPQTYVVEADDNNIYRIAQKLCGESAKFSLILKANNLGEDPRLVAGTILKIPCLATPTLTATPTSKPSATITVRLSTATMTVTATPTPGIGSPPPPPNGTGNEQLDIMKMLIAFSTSTLVGSSIICGFLAIWVYTSAHRVADQQAMVRRIRPPLRR